LISPTQRTIRELKNIGRRCGIVERFNAHIGEHGIRQDLFGIIDIIALDPQLGVVGIQCCGSAFSEHYKKITQTQYQETLDWLRTPHTRLEIWSWAKRKIKRGGKAFRWRPRVVEIGLIDIGADGSEWREIPGYDGEYEISSTGFVRSSARTVNKIILHPGIDSHGYSQVQLRGRNMKLVHRLVAEVFIPNPENKPEVNHIDGDSQNNHAENLEWVTGSENCLHSTRILGKVRGFVKLTVADVREIKRRLADGERKKDIAGRFDMAESTVSNIASGRRWANV